MDGTMTMKLAYNAYMEDLDGIDKNGGKIDFGD